jgi:hypothetical protein
MFAVQLKYRPRLVQAPGLFLDIYRIYRKGYGVIPSLYGAYLHARDFVADAVGTRRP